MGGSEAEKLPRTLSDGFEQRVDSKRMLFHGLRPRHGDRWPRNKRSCMVCCMVLAVD